MRLLPAMEDHDSRCFEISKPSVGGMEGWRDGGGVRTVLRVRSEFRVSS